MRGWVPRTTARAAASVTLALVMGVVGSAVDGGRGRASAAADPASTAPPCELPVGDQNLGDADGALVILLDGSTSSAEQPDRATDLGRLLDTATADDALMVSIGSFGGSDAEVRFSPCLDGVLFVPDGNNHRTRDRNRPGLLDAAGEQLAALETGYGTSDPTSALRAGVRRLADDAAARGGDDPFTRTLVIHTDGIPTTGCAALPAQVDVSQPGLVDTLVAACVDAGQLPDATGVDIVVAGVGRPDQDLTADAVTFLLQLTTSLCAATGAASCRVDPNLPPDV